MSRTTKLLIVAKRIESGQNLIEYALAAGLIALTAVVAMSSLSTTLGASLTSAGTRISAAV